MSKDELDKHFKQKKREPYMEYSNTLVRATKMRNIMRQAEAPQSCRLKIFSTRVEYFLPEDLY